MAYTPNNSFGSDDIQQRGRPTKRRALTPTPSKLPSPQATDTYDSSSDADKVLEAIAHDIQLDDTHSSAEDSEIERAFQVLWSLFCGLPEPTSTTPRFHFHCGQRSYERLYTRLHEHPGLFAYFETLRVDWNAATGVLVIRSMPARPIHDIFQNALVLSIERELDHVAVATPALQPFRSKLSAGGTTAIEKRKKGARRNQPPEFEKSPDGQWLWAGNRYPAFVFEVAYSQEEESLADKVAQFFEQLPSDIGSVLGFDIEYADKADRRKDHFHGATVSLWVSEPSDDDQALDVTRTIHQEPFRDRRGKALPGELRLPFSLFVPFRERHTLPPSNSSTDICLTFAHLCELVDNAERLQCDIEATVSPSPAPDERAPKRFKRVRFRNKDGTVTRNTDLAKQARGKKGLTEPPRARTRSQSQPRRSDRLRSRTRYAQG